MPGETKLKVMDNPLVRITAEGKSLSNAYISRVQLFRGELEVTPSSDLSPKELNTLVMGSVGMTVEDIAATIWEAPDTTKSRRRVISRKLGAINLIHATTVAFERGIYKTILPAPLPKNLPSDRQLDFLHARAAGMSVPQAAQALNIEVGTIRTHQEKTAQKFGLREVTQQVLFGYLCGLLVPQATEIPVQYAPSEELSYAVNS